VARGLVLLLVLLVGIHHALMLAPVADAHGASAMAVADSHDDGGAPCDGLCPTCAAAVCAAVISAAAHVPAPPPAALLVLTIGVLLVLLHRGSDRLPWLWPPERRRPLLQIFLI
jgi:hypothetical protein